MAEPVSVELVKQQIEFFETDRDDLIAQKITAAREWVEDETGLILVRRSFTEQHKPCHAGHIYLYKRPIVSITSVKYLDSDGVEQTFADHHVIGGRVKALSGSYWPSATDGFEITYEAGLADDETPRRLIEAMLVLIGGMFAEREGAYDRSEEAARSLVQKHMRYSV